jgi:hypothetical protein
VHVLNLPTITFAKFGNIPVNFTLPVHSLLILFFALQHILWH